MLFGQDEVPSCMKSLDVNDDGSNDISEAVALLLHLFVGSFVPADPFETCGHDETEDSLSCDNFDACA